MRVSDERDRIQAILFDGCRNQRLQKPDRDNVEPHLDETDREIHAVARGIPDLLFHLRREFLQELGIRKETEILSRAFQTRAQIALEEADDLLRIGMQD